MRVCGQLLEISWSPAANPCETVTKPFLNQKQEQKQEQNNTGLQPPGCVQPEKPKPEQAEPPGFVSFWQTWPSNTRKAGRSKCLDVWKRAGLERHAEQVIAHVTAMKATRDWQKEDGQFVPAPLVYLNGKRWDGADTGHSESQSLMAGVI